MCVCVSVCVFETLKSLPSPIQQVLERLPKHKAKVQVEGSVPPRTLVIKSKYLFVGKRVRWDGLHHGTVVFTCVRVCEREFVCEREKERE